MKRNRMQTRRGFTLVEALVALTVTAFGMLAIAGFQASLSQASENAKYRAEATRLAQAKMEELRAYLSRTADAGKFDYTDIATNSSGEQLANTATDGSYLNTIYSRKWWVTTSDGTTASGNTDSNKFVRVQVAWTDRRNETQTVQMQSVVALSSPIDIGTLAVGSDSTSARRPKNRSIDIPYPAVTLQGNKSAFKPDGSSYTYVFSNTSGNVVGRCSQTLNEGDSVNVDSTAGTITSGCVELSAYLLSGYIRFLNSAMPSGNELQVDSGLSNTTDATLDLSVAVTFPSFFSSMTPTPTQECFAKRRKIITSNSVASYTVTSVSRTSNLVTVVLSVSNHGIVAGMRVALTGTGNSTFVGSYAVSSVSGTTISYYQSGSNATASTGTLQIPNLQTVDEGTSYNNFSTTSSFVAYTCVITPADHDSNAATSKVWWGKLLITPITTPTNWSIGTGASNNKVCRFTGDYVKDGTISNAEHPYWYRAVSGTLDNQNYLIIGGNKTCPSDDRVDYTASGDYVNTNTVNHQTSGSTGGSYSTDNAQWATAAEPNSEPTSTSSILPMYK